MVKIDSSIFDRISKSLNKQKVTFQTRKKGIVLEKKPVPAYTRTEKQNAVRTKYKQLCEQWKTLTKEEKQQYAEIARRYNITLFNAFLKVNLKVEIITFDNSGGGSWKYYINAKLQSELSEDAVYIISIDSTNVTILNAERQNKINSQIAETFWQNVKQDGSDIRAFDQNKQQLYFYVDKFDYANQQALIFVRLQTGATELNIAIGNNLAQQSGYNNPYQTFDAYDDFEDGDYSDKWERVSGVATEENGYLELGSTSTSPGIIYYKLKQFSDGFVIESKFNHITTNDLGQIIFHYTDSGNMYMLTFGYQNTLAIVRRQNASDTTLSSTTQAVAENVWYDARVTRKQDGTIKQELIGIKTLTATDTTFSTGYVGYRVGGLFNDITRFDNFRLYKINDPAVFTELSIKTLQT